MSTAALNIQPSDPPHHGPACDPILTVSAVSQVFPGAGSAASVHALDDVSLTVAPGEFVAIVGPSGCGKSTLLRLAAGLGRPTKGGIAFGGDILTGPRREIGMIFQDSVMLPWFTVLENVVLPQRIARQDLPQARARARHMLRHVGLGGFEDARPDALSGGMRQRAAIARALLTDPSLLLMDEPFGALDALTRERMNLQLSGIAEESGCAVLLITHSIAEAVFLADRVVVMTARPGRIADEIPVDLPRPRGPDTLSHPAFAALSERLRRHFHVDRHGLD